MSHELSATKLVKYQQCPQSYYFKHVRKLKSPSFFGSTKLGNALHHALKIAYKDWHYQELKPEQKWFDTCWNVSIDGLTKAQVKEGRKILKDYYKKFVEPLPSMAKPLGVESRAKAFVQFENIEFEIEIRYDRVDYFGNGGLELIDYKSGRNVTIPDSIDVQLGVYFMALEATYPEALKQLTLIYLRTGEQLSFEATPEYKEQVMVLLSDLALKLRFDEEWKPIEGTHCKVCTYQKYCSAKTDKPELLPSEGLQGIQLSFLNCP